MRKIATVLILLMVMSVALTAAEPDFQEMLRKIDDMGNFADSDFYAEYTLTSQKPGEPVAVTKAQMFRRDRNEQFVFIILEPQEDSGKGYLKVDDNVWIYDPQSRAFNHSSLKEEIQNTDTKNSDLTSSSLAEDYTVTRSAEGTLGAFPVWILELTARNNEVSYAKIIIWVHKASSLILKEEDYSVSNRLLRTVAYSSYMKVGDKFLPGVITQVDNVAIGERTIVQMANPSVAVIPNDRFTKSFLERASN
ncbi:MAG: outer membrane lipoprotein-sorting protein [Spirochaetes bacterium]|nr:outer membrane lipoprotein-sorting protein [Spirochaetota bacterium]MBU0954673.1 outer membrane lipoprotein-sorting protein [Spirochaetota bacterium]